MVECLNAPKTIQRDNRNHFQMLCSGFKSPACSHLDLSLLQTCTCALHLYSTINYSLLLQRSFRATLFAAGLKCLITEVQQGLETAADRSLARSPHVLAMFWCCCAAGRKAWWPLTACTVRVVARTDLFSPTGIGQYLCQDVPHNPVGVSRDAQLDHSWSFCGGLPQKEVVCLNTCRHWWTLSYPSAIF